ncbi:MAG TPA: hypothetical protein VGC37_00435, partial [Friedmanniella sp.]
HLLKTHAGHRLRQISPGVFEWTTSAGHCYLSVPGAAGSSVYLGRTGVCDTRTENAREVGYSFADPRDPGPDDRQLSEPSDPDASEAIPF